MQNNHRLSLDGSWDFHIGAHDVADISDSQEWRTAEVPMPWQAQFADLRHTSGVGWYRRTFTAASDLFDTITEPAAVLHFGAVDYHATVWLNGTYVDKHKGGYLPFEFAVTDLLHEGENELLVRVIDATDNRELYPDFPFSEVPHGKQSWYGPLGGIWQSVWLEFRPKFHITHLALHPVPAEAIIQVQVELSDIPPSGYQISCTVADAGGNEVGVATWSGLSGTIQLDSAPQLWSPDEPHLYTVTTTLEVHDHSAHAVSKSCGFRTVEASNGRIYLNGQPIYLRGVLDQAYYSETIYTPNSVELLEDQARKLKALGFNCLRTHIKIEDPRYYDVADRLGLLVWTEIPNWALLTEASSERAKETFKAMVKRDNHHPSIIAWTLINENWGTDLTRNPEHRQWLADFYEEAKAIDPTRLVVDNSACVSNAHVTGDVEDYHYYQVIPDHADGWDKWVADFAGRSEWAWYADFAHNRRADLPLLVSEFGNWGLPDPATIQEHGQEPWWFETGHNWGEGIVYPHGVLERYEACGLDKLFPSYADFAKQSQEHMARSLHYEITTMRLYDSIAGYVITEFTDVHWECNGLLTMQREVKHALDPLLKEINQDWVVLLRPQRWSGRSGDALPVVVQTKDILGEQTEGIIRWQAGSASGELAAPGGTITVELASVGEVTLSAQWLNAEGAQLATNQVNLVCVNAAPITHTPLRIIDNPSLANTLRDLGYVVNEGQLETAKTDEEIVVANYYTQPLQTYIQKGGRVLLLAESTAPKDVASTHLPAGRLVSREGTAWQGDWANSFAWINKSGALAHIPGQPLLEMEWVDLMPDVVIDGLPSWVQQDHSMAGLAVGWVHKPVSLLTVLEYGRGRILLTTFKLNETTLAADALGQSLFASLLNML